MATTHTPGPWKVYDGGSDTLHIGTVAPPSTGWDYNTVCAMFEDKADNYDTHNEFVLFPNAAENARLIAAAPDLLAALEYAAQPMGLSKVDFDTWLLKARTAIAKARGEG